MAAKKSRKRKSAKSPWERPAPRRSRHTKLTSEDKAQAKRRAKKAGRTYPNLVDNMAQAKRKRGTRRAPAKEERGGLTAAGRALFSRLDRTRLRFMGGRKLPLLTDGSGKPTRIALSARAWSDWVPRTIAAARRMIAAKGRKLLERYRLQQA